MKKARYKMYRAFLSSFFLVVKGIHIVCKGGGDIAFCACSFYIF